MGSKIKDEIKNNIKLEQNMDLTVSVFYYNDNVRDIVPEMERLSEKCEWNIQKPQEQQRLCGCDPGV